MYTLARTSLVPCCHVQIPVISAAAVLLYLDSTHPSHVVIASITAAIRDVIPEPSVDSGSEFMDRTLYASTALLSAAALLCLMLFKFFRSIRSTPSMTSSRTISISEVDNLMMKYSCGCDCGQVTGISKVQVAPSPELSFEPSQPQLKLDSCDAVGIFYSSACSLCSRVVLQLQPVALAACYMREFLAKSHPLVQRSGPVCP
jgi:hypothetical protein